jgi:beta-glucosidase
MSLSVFLPAFGAGGVSAATTLLPPTNIDTEFTSDEDVYNAGNALNERLVEEGAVLLKNDGGALPLSSGAKISVFGKNSYNLSPGGTGSSTGSGSIEAVASATLYGSLEDAGFELNPALVAFYGDNSKSGAGRSSAGMGSFLYNLPTGETPVASYASNGLTDFTEYGDAALFVITRVGGEGYDLPPTMVNSAADRTPIAGAKADQHYLELDKNESEVLTMICSKFAKVVLIINSSHQMELGFLDDSANADYHAQLKAALWIGGTGGVGVNAVGRILDGTVNPSGRTADIYTRDFTADPTYRNMQNNIYYANAAATAGEGHTFVDYEEGVYLGYKYYETRAETEKGTNPTWYAQNVVYPFGYGLSYTNFTWTQKGDANLGALNADDTISVQVEVQNTGSVPGKEVVQLYYSAPYDDGASATRIEKPYVALAQFAKTAELAPGGKETVTIDIPVRAMASYDWNDANKNGFKGWEVEAGTYKIKLMANSHGASSVSNGGDVEFTATVANHVGATQSHAGAAVTGLASSTRTGWVYNKDDVTGNTITNLFDDISVKAKAADDRGTATAATTGGVMRLMSRKDFAGTFPKAPYGGAVLPNLPAATSADGDAVRDPKSDSIIGAFDPTLGTADTSDDVQSTAAGDDVNRPWTVTVMPNFATAEMTAAQTAVKLKDLIRNSGEYATVKEHFDAPAIQAKLQQLVEQLTLDQLGALINNGAFMTINLDNIGKPFTMEFDGPVGLVPRQTTGPYNGFTRRAVVYATEVVVASTWNQELVYEYGKMTGEEGVWGNGSMAYSGIYAPGANIHRTPFAGRNFEYYSEDGVLSGIMAANYCKGMQEKGIYTFMKHFLLNDQETNRGATLYTWVDEQAFREIYLRAFEYGIKGGAMGLMTGYNAVGTVWNGNNYNLMTRLIRDEWGFTGMAITDWGGIGDWTSPTSQVNTMIRAGTDLVLAGTSPLNLSYAGNRTNPTQIAAMQRAAKAILYTVAQSNAMVPRILASSVDLAAIPYTEGQPIAPVMVGAQFNYEADPTATISHKLTGGLPGGVTMSAAGVLSGTPALPSFYGPNPTEYTFTVTSTVTQGSSINMSVEKTFTLKQAALISVNRVTTGTTGKAYFSDSIKAAGDPDITYMLQPEVSMDLSEYFGLPPGSWIYVITPASTLPEGLTLNADGSITGTPTAAADNHSFVVVASSTGKVPVEWNYTISVGLGAVEMGVPYNGGGVAFAGVGTELAPTTYTATGLPEGLTVGADGSITGTPTAAGSFTLAVTATAPPAFGQFFPTVTVATFALNVNKALTYSGAGLATGVNGTAYTASAATATGGSAVIYALKEGSALPAGLTLNADGSITGTPTAEGTFLFTVVATSSDAGATETTFALTVVAKPEEKPDDKTEDKGCKKAADTATILSVLSVLGLVAVKRKRA